ncbi:hypothetical protein [Mycoplasma hafezii]|uniref:hypothetical protein n=1 Tax=Mycoplasma hafezii TaxID=525886 RepID=UPI003CF72261
MKKKLLFLGSVTTALMPLSVISCNFNAYANADINELQGKEFEYVDSYQNISSSLKTRIKETLTKITDPVKFHNEAIEYEKLNGYYATLIEYLAKAKNIEAHQNWNSATQKSKETVLEITKQINNSDLLIKQDDQYLGNNINYELVKTETNKLREAVDMIYYSSAPKKLSALHIACIATFVPLFLILLTLYIVRKLKDRKDKQKDQEINKK